MEDTCFHLYEGKKGESVDKYKLKRVIACDSCGIGFDFNEEFKYLCNLCLGEVKVIDFDNTPVSVVGIAVG